MASGSSFFSSSMLEMTLLRSACSSKLSDLRDVVEDAEVVDDQAVRLLRVRAVRAADRLQQVWSRIGLSRYIACRIGASKPVSSLRRHDEDLQRIGRVAEAVEQLLLVVLARVRSGRATPAASPLADGHHDFARLGRQDLVERVLVEHARFPVEGDDLRLEAVRLRPSPGSARRCHRTTARDALGRLHQDRQPGGAS